MIKLSRPYIPDAAYEKVTDVLKSGNLVQGEYVLKFENALRDYLGSDHVIIVSSGTAALHLSLIALGIGPGDEVIIPAFTFPATANVVELTGAKPVFIDIGLDDFCIDNSQIEAAINERTKAIMPVHEFGQSAKMDDILSLSRKYGLYIIEDGACALGTEFNGKKAGTFGEFGCFSFHPRKAVTTGEGGAIVTNDAALAKKVRSLRNHGIEIVEGRIEFNHAGLNYRLTDFQAVIGYYQLMEIDHIIDHRIRMAGLYNEKLSGINGISTPGVFPYRKNVYQSYHILLDEKIDRDRLKARLLEAGIETNYGANALALLNYYKSKYNFHETMFPCSSFSFFHGLALPMSHYLDENDIATVCIQLIKSISNGNG